MAAPAVGLLRLNIPRGTKNACGEHPGNIFTMIIKKMGMGTLQDASFDAEGKMFFFSSVNSYLM